MPSVEPLYRDAPKASGTAPTTKSMSIDRHTVAK
jgi:hypothetical protein